MKPSSFTPRGLRQRRFFNFLLPFLAIFLGAGAGQQVLAQGTNTDNVTIYSQATSSSAATTQVYDGTSPDVPVNPNFDGAVLGSNISQNGGSLTLTAAYNDLNTTSTRAIVASRLEYRVYLSSASTLPAFTTLNLPRTSASDFGSNVILQEPNANVDLLNQPAVLGGGTYTVEIRFVNTRKNGTGTTTFSDGPYYATFTVVPPAVTPPGGTTTWIATVSTDWTNPANWSNGVPTRFSDAILPAKNGTASNTSTPALLDQNPNLYEVRTLNMLGTGNDNRALLRIGQTTSANVTTGATLNVYGDLNVLGGGILASQSGANGVANQALNSTIFMRGDKQQVIRGLLEIADIHFTGNGDKLVVNSINVSNTLTFEATANSRVRTVYETQDPNTNTPVFTLNTSKTANVDLKSTGIMSGETNVAYIEGVTLADRNLFAGQKQTFGNIGVDITPNRDILGPTVQITRTVGNPLSGNAGNASQPIKRQYGVSGDVNNAPTVSTLVFHYLDSADELNGNTPETALTIFKTTNNGIPYQLIGGTDDPVANTVTQTGVTAINTITLGNRNNPLPVTVSSFDVKRVGTDALVSWTTAQEVGNKGFNVQVSTDAKTYRTLGFVASASPNSTSARSYSFTDTEKNKAGVRYYRLQQLDLDGKTAFFAPRALTFEGRATEAGLVAYPNPYSSDLRVSLNSAVSGNAVARISDMTGRVIGQQVLPLTIGSNDLALDNVAGLKTGLYLLNITLPSGEVKTLKVVKQ